MTKLFKAVAAVLLVGACAQAQVVNPNPAFPLGQFAPSVMANYQAYAQAATITATNLQCITNGPAVATSPGALIQPIVPAPGAGASQGTSQLQVGICPAGNYELIAHVNTSNGLSGSGSVTVTAGYTAGGTAQTPTVLSSTTLSAGAVKDSVFSFRSDGTANITFTATWATSGSYDIQLVLVRVL